MQRIDPPTVKPGQPVTTALFAQMARAVRALRLIAGDGVRLRFTPNGTFVSLYSRKTRACAFQVSLQGLEAAIIAPGTINKIAATIKGKPLDGGKNEDPRPLLEFGKPRVGSDGRGWIAAEITCDPLAQWTIKTVEIVQVADCDTPDGAPATGLPNAAGGSLPLPGFRARHPLAMLVQRKSGRLDVFQITCFDLQHRVKFADDLKTPTRHFFY